MLKITNDPVNCVLESFNQLHGDVPVEIWYDPKMPTHGKNKRCGETIFPDDGSIPIILINANIPFYAVSEILAHELAHVLTPKDTDHGVDWQNAFAAIHERYDEIAQTRFAVNDGSGK